jgi:hypothetical protein
MISDLDRNHIYEILTGHGDWFGAMLIRLIGHADGENREKLRQAYPDYMEAYLDWDRKTGAYANRKNDP